MVRDTPPELLKHLDGCGLLSFQAIWINGIEQVDGIALSNLLQELEAAVEIGLKLDGERAIFERLRQFSPCNLSFRNQDQAPQICACCIGSHRRRGISGRGAPDPLESLLLSNGKRNGHASVFE